MGAPATPAPRVLIVDDHPLWRHTLRSVLERSGVVGDVLEAGDGAQAATMASAQSPELVIMDMELPERHGIAATREIVEKNPGTRVLVLSSSDDRGQVLAAVRAGASGYLIKTTGSGEIIDGVRRVLAGELVFPPQLASFVLAELRGTPSRSAVDDPLAELTERERRVLALMAEGHVNEAIGRTLHISAKTVEAHVTTIFEKLGLGEVSGGHKRVLAVIAYLNAAANSRADPI